jgi:hypothetical protein
MGGDRSSTSLQKNMRRHTRGLGADKSPKDPHLPDEKDLDLEKKIIPRQNSHLLLPLSVGGAILLGGAAFLFVNSSSIDLICRQAGNCQSFKDASGKAQESLKKAEDELKSAKSLPELLNVRKSIDEAKNSLTTISDNATDLKPSIGEQKTKVADFGEKVGILVALEQNADKSLKEAIAKIVSADALNRDRQGATETPDSAKKRLNSPKAIYVEAQVLLQSIPDNSFAVASKKEKLKQVADKIKDLDGKLGAIAALDPCVTNPDSCKPVDPCVANPAACAAAPPVAPAEPLDNNQAAPPQSSGKRPLFGPGSAGY